MIKQFLSCDWGTSSFRLRLLDATGNKVLATVKDSHGIAAAYQKWIQSGLDESRRVSFYKNILQQYIDQLNCNVAGLPMLISGMASSSIGVKDIPYGRLPFNLSADRFPIDYIPKDDQFSHDLYIISGLKTDRDAMRGEETILFGCDTVRNDGIYVFPGTHSKHVSVKNNTAVDVKTYMTGELFDLLANKSILSSSVVKSDADTMEEYFKLGVLASKEGAFLNNIFHVRTNLLFEKLQPSQNYHYLSGLLIGTEMKAIDNEDNIFIVSEHTLLSRYLKAAEVLQLQKVSFIDSDDAFNKAHFKIAGMLFKSCIN